MRALGWCRGCLIAEMDQRTTLGRWREISAFAAALPLFYIGRMNVVNHVIMVK